VRAAAAPPAVAPETRLAKTMAEAEKGCCEGACCDDEEEDESDDADDEELIRLPLISSLPNLAHHRSVPDLTGSSSAQYSAENGTSRASVAAEPVHAALTAAVTPGPEGCGSAAGRRRIEDLKEVEEEGEELEVAAAAAAEAFLAATHSGGACALVLASSSGDVASTATALAAPPAKAGATASDASSLAIELSLSLPSPSTFPGSALSATSASSYSGM
jgi:hypothetical protein